MTTKHVPYAAFFLGLPPLITQPGRYVTRSGEVVQVDDTSNTHWKRGAYPCGTAETWNRSGRIFSGRETPNDIVRAE